MPLPQNILLCFCEEEVSSAYLYRVRSNVYWCVSIFCRFRTAGAMHPLQCVLQAQRSLKWGPLSFVSWLLLRICRAHSSVPTTSSPEGQSSEDVQKDFSSRLAAGPTFQHFLRSASVLQEKPSSPQVEDPPPYVTGDELLGRQRKGWFYFTLPFV